MPAAAYVTLAAAKAWLGESGTENDAAIEDAIAKASQAVESYCSRDFASGQRTEQVFGSGSQFLFMKHTPITAVASCIVRGQAISVDFNIMAVRRTDGGTFGVHDAPVVTYTAGLAQIPEDVKLATLLTVQAIRGAPALDPNLAGESTVGFGSASYMPEGPGTVPRAARDLLEKTLRRY